MIGFIAFVCIFSDLSPPFRDLFLSCLASQYTATNLGQLHVGPSVFTPFVVSNNSNDTSCHLLFAHSVPGAKPSSLRTLSLYLPSEAVNVTLILEPKKQSLEEVCVPKDTQLVNGETRAKTQDTDSRVHALAC